MAGEGGSYGNLGNAYRGPGQFKTAIEYHQRRLEIAKEVGDMSGEGRGYCGLGNAYHSLGQFNTAIEYQQRSSEITKEVGDKAEEGGSYGNLGCAYHSLGQFKTAIEYHQRHLEIAKGVGEISKEVGDKTGEACSLCSLGSIFECQGNLMMAFDCYYLSVQLYDDIRASLQLNDRWKICYRNQHQSAYEGLWRINLNQGQVVKALLTAEKGSAQALNWPMDGCVLWFSVQSKRKIKSCYSPVLPIPKHNVLYIKRQMYLILLN